jgi:hypothetical protein
MIRSNISDYVGTAYIVQIEREQRGGARAQLESGAGVPYSSSYVLCLFLLYTPQYIDRENWARSRFAHEVPPRPKTETIHYTAAAAAAAET